MTLIYQALYLKDSPHLKWTPKANNVENFTPPATPQYFAKCLPLDKMTFQLHSGIISESKNMFIKGFIMTKRYCICGGQKFV